MPGKDPVEEYNRSIGAPPLEEEELDPVEAYNRSIGAPPAGTPTVKKKDQPSIPTTSASSGGDAGLRSQSAKELGDILSRPQFTTAGKSGLKLQSSEDLANVLLKTTPQSELQKPIQVPVKGATMETRTREPAIIEQIKEAAAADENQSIEARRAELKKQDTGMGRFSSAVGSLDQGIATGVSQTSKAIAIGAKYLQDAAPEWLKDDETKNLPLEQTATYRFGTWLDEKAKEMFPTNPAYQDEFLTTMTPNVLGQMLQMFAGGGAVKSLFTKGAAREAGEVAATKWATGLAEKGLAKEATKDIVTTAAKESTKGIAGKVIQGATKLAEKSSAEGAFYALSGGAQQGAGEYEQAYQALKKKGVPEAEARAKAFDTFKYNALLVGGADAIPLMGFLSKLNKATGGDIMPAMLKQAGEGAFTEGLEKVGENVIAKLNYDDSRKLLDGVIQEGGAAGLVNFFLLGAAKKTKNKLDQGGLTPEQRAQELKKLDYINEKLGETIRAMEAENVAKRAAAAEPEGQVEGEAPIQEETQAPVAPQLSPPEVVEELPQEGPVAPDQAAAPQVTPEQLSQLPPEEQKAVLMQMPLEQQQVFVAQLPPEQQQVLTEDAIASQQDQGAPVESPQTVPGEEAPVVQQAPVTLEQIIQLPPEEQFTALQQLPQEEQQAMIAQMPPEQVRTLVDLANSQGGETVQPPPVAPAATPPVAPVTPAAKPTVETTPPNKQKPGPEDKVRQHERITKGFEKGRISKEVAEGLTEDVKNYIVKGDKATIEEVKFIVEEKGLEQATKEFYNDGNGYHPKTRVLLGETLLQKQREAINKETDPKEKERLVQESIGIWTNLAARGTEHGQAIQAFALFEKMHPAAIAKATAKIIKDSGDAQLAKAAKEIQDIMKAVEAGDSEAIGRLKRSEVFKNVEKIIKGEAEASTVKPTKPKTETKTTEAKPKTETKKKTDEKPKTEKDKGKEGDTKEPTEDDKAKAVRREKVKKAVDYLESLKIKPSKGQANDITQVIGAPVYNTAISAMQKGIKGGLTLTESVEKAIKYINSQYKEKWDEKSFRESMLGNEQLKEADLIAQAERKAKEEARAAKKEETKKEKEQAKKDKDAAEEDSVKKGFQVWEQYKADAIKKLKKRLKPSESDGDVDADVADSPALEEFTDRLVQRLAKTEKPPKTDVEKKVASALRGTKPANLKEKTIEALIDKTVKESKLPAEAVREEFQNQIDSAKLREMSKAEALEEALNNVDKYKDTFLEVKSELDKQGVNTSDLGTIFELPYFKKAIEGKVKTALNKEGIDLGQLVEKHYSEVDRTTEGLAEKMIKEYNMPAEDAAAFSQAIHEEFDKQATAAKQRRLKQAMPVTKRGSKKRRALHEEIVRLSNLGGLKTQEVRDLFAKKMGIQTELTAEQGTELMALTDKIQQAKEGRQKSMAIEDLLRYHSKLKGITIGDIAMSMYMSNILSGPTTAAQNVYDNTNRAFAEYWTEAFKNPKQAGYMAKDMFMALSEGGIEAWNVFSTGYQSAKGGNKYGDRTSVLETVKFKGGRANPLNWQKYLGRILPALDALTYYPLRALRSRSKAAEMVHLANLRRIENAQNTALREGLEPNSKAYDDRVSELSNQKGKLSDLDAASEILNNNKEAVDKAKAQATSEGLKGLKHRSRVNELIEQGRPDDLRADAEDFASSRTLTSPGLGILGLGSAAVENVVNMAQYKGVKPLKFIIPFTNAVVNLTNYGLDWTPYGLIRRVKGGIGLQGWANGRYHKSYDPELSPGLRAKKMFQTVAGSLAMAAIYQLSEDDGPLEITADGYGDSNKNQEMEKTWQEFSVRYKGGDWISYKNTPLAIGMAMIGYMRDAEKYRGKDDNWADEAAYMAIGAMRFISSATWMKSAYEFLGSFSGDDEGAFEKGGGAVAKAVKSMVPVLGSNAIPQSKQIYQQIMGQPRKIARNPWDKIRRDMPFMGDDLNNVYNHRGEPVIPDPGNKLIPFQVKSTADADKIDLFLSKHALNTGVPERTSERYDPKLGKMRVMTDDEWSKYSLLSAKLTIAAVKEKFETLREKPTRKEKQLYLKSLGDKARRKARRQLFPKG